MQVLKIGGSVLEDERPVTGYGSALAPHLDELIVVHGVGSSPRALIPKDHRGRRFNAGSTPLVTAVRGAVETVHRNVVGALRADGLPAVGVAPDAWLRFERGVLTADTDAVLAIVRRGELPVLYGSIFDRSDDRAHPYEIVSSDHVVVSIATALTARSVVWATDAAGVLDNDGNVIIDITDTSLAKIERRRTDEVDPTGAMTTKLAAAFELSARGIESRVVNGRSPDAVAAALRGDQVGSSISAYSVTFAHDQEPS